MKTEAIIVGTDGAARLTELELPALTDTRVRVETLYSGVSCGTEGDCASGRAAYMPRPFLTGYQAVGRVAETGRLVRAVRPGDLVFSCGGGLWGMTHLAGGSHARQFVAEETGLIKLSPKGASLRGVAYTCLAAIGMEALSRLKLEPGRPLLVFGLGMLGQMTGRIGQLLGLRVVGVNRSAWKAELAKGLGFDAVCAPELPAIQAALKGLGFGPAKYAVDTTGNQQVFDLALAALGPWSELVLAGYYPDQFVVNFDLCHGRQMAIHNPVGFGPHMPRTAKWIEDGVLNLDPLLRHTVAPSQVTEFYADLVQNHSQYLGVVIDWQAQ